VDDIRKANEQMQEGVNKAVEGNTGKEENNTTSTITDQNTNNTNTESGNSIQNGNSNSTDPQKTNFKSYQNYDFVAGEKILFEDNFTSDMDGEFPAHWDLIYGQAVVNKYQGKTAMLITDGGYGRVIPLVKNKTYLASEFTIEFDYFPIEGAYSLKLSMFNMDGLEGDLDFSSEGVGGTFSDKYLFGRYSEDKIYGNFYNKWHHIALAYKNNQLKVYVDDQRLLVMPNIAFQPVSMDIHGSATQDFPIVFTNVKIAEGGKMNMLDKIMTDGKIITHGILFDVNKATIKPESMGVLNQIYQLLKDNADLKFEIGGFTDSDGDDNSNLKLSEQRAIAVKEQLVSMGISADRLTTKGYGETNPIDANTSPEGKANNRRVEFTKK
jgi:OOP family OmpA-OmpF porin